MPIDQFIKSQVLFNNSGKIKIKKPPVWLFPFSAERIYRRELLEFQKIYEQQVDLIILPQIDFLVRRAAVNRPDSNNIRLDQEEDSSYTSQVTALVAGLALSYKLLVTDRTIDKTALNQAFRVSGFNQQQFTKVLETSLSVNPVGDEPFLQDQIKAFTKQNVSLITNIGDEQTRRIEEGLLRDLSAGLGSAEIRQNLIKVENFSRNRAKLIARDQTAKFNSELSGLRMLNIGIEEYRWLTAGDERVRPTHRAQNGKIFRNDTPPSGTGHPGHDVNCRCTRQAVITDELFTD